MLVICLSYACDMLAACFSFRTQSGTAPTDRKAKKMNSAPNERLTWTIVLVICLSYACHMLAICWSYACHKLAICLSYARHKLVICLSFACHMPVTCLQYASYSMCTELGTVPTNRKAEKMNRAPNERLTWTIMLVICLPYACHMPVICLSYACHMLVTLCLSYAWHMLACLQCASYSMCTYSGTAPTDRKTKKIDRAPNESLT